MESETPVPRPLSPSSSSSSPTTRAESSGKGSAGDIAAGNEEGSDDDEEEEEEGVRLTVTGGSDTIRSYHLVRDNASCEIKGWTLTLNQNYCRY